MKIKTKHSQLSVG